MLAMEVNDNAGVLIQRGELRFFASKLAPAVEGQTMRSIHRPRYRSSPATGSCKVIRGYARAASGL
ncbi:hypothetical protein EQV97_10120 [Pseudomonas sp. TMW22090]|nr:hypothetical protein [Pseudomonas sp. TMW22090]